MLYEDLAVLDIGLPGIGGIEAARQILQVSPTLKIIFLSQIGPDEKLMTSSPLRVLRGNCTSEAHDSRNKNWRCLLSAAFAGHL
jgi:CheY-like chemotaxis protein